MVDAAELFCELDLKSKADDLHAHLRFNIPRWKCLPGHREGHELDYWECKFSVNYGDDKGIYTNIGTGDDAIQALMMAIKGAHINLKKHGDSWLDQNDIPDWMLFPKTITIGWGKEFYDEAVAKVEEMERKKNAEIEQRRKKRQV